MCLFVAEISRVRKDMYNDTLNGSTEKRSSELPDAVGPIVQLQEKLYVPVKEYPDVSINLFTPSAGDQEIFISYSDLICWLQF